jgi:galactose mutarotase-like enzyme
VSSTRTCAITWGAVSGWDTVVLESDGLRVTVLPDKGADIYELLHVPTGTDVLFKAPWGLLPPGAPPRQEADGLEFIGNYEGGWQELFPNANDACAYEGVDVPFHGEVALVPWAYEILEEDEDSVAIRLSVRCRTLPLALERVMRLTRGTPELTITGTVTNAGSTRLPFVWGHHLVLGPPFLEAGCRLELPATTIVTAEQVWEETARLQPGQESEWPHARLREGGTVDLREIPGAEAESHDDLFVGGFAEGRATVANPRLGLTFSFSWDAQTFPWVVLWQPYGGARDPSLAGSYALGVEPWTARHCLGQAVEKNAATWLEPGKSLTTTLVAGVEPMRDA